MQRKCSNGERLNICDASCVLQLVIEYCIVFCLNGYLIATSAGMMDFSTAVTYRGITVPLITSKSMFCCFSPLLFAALRRYLLAKNNINGYPFISSTFAILIYCLFVSRQRSIGSIVTELILSCSIWSIAALMTTPSGLNDSNGNMLFLRNASFVRKTDWQTSEQTCSSLNVSIAAALSRIPNNGNNFETTESQHSNVKSQLSRKPLNYCSSFNVSIAAGKGQQRLCVECLYLISV